MRLSIALAATLASQLVSGHAYVWGISINGKDMGRGDAVGSYIRKIFDNNPVKNVKSPDMTCNRNKGPNTKTLDVKGGDKITVEWAHNNRGDEVIADSHKGPVQVYVAPTSSNGKGNVWVKIASEAFDGNKWATDKLRANHGKHNFVMPHLAPGAYLIRPEIIALHEGQNVGGAQIYMACVQVKVSGGSGEKLPAGVSIPGVYTAEDPGIRFNVYNKQNNKYRAPGGAVKKLQKK